MVTFSRRKFLNLMGASAVGTVALSPLQAFMVRKALGQNPSVTGFGSLSPKLPTIIDPRATPVFDISTKQPLLEIPDGFEYMAFHVSGMLMSDGNPCPSDHDGMACFERGNNLILVQNHELSVDEDDGSGYRGGTGQRKAYDKFDGQDSQGFGAGGTSTIILNKTNGDIKRDYISLAGTIRNCAGGPTPWGSWISCEETTDTPLTDANLTKKHGYNFEVKASAGSIVKPVPLVAMGRFNHEAIAVDPQTGYVYETEDKNDSCIYRFKPTVSGNLARGGDLEVLTIEGGSQDLTSFGDLNQPLKVKWVNLTQAGVNVDPDEDNADLGLGLRYDAQNLGGAIFRRGEGAWAGNGKIYWVCTTGGSTGNGQVWSYDDQSQTVTLIVDSPGDTELDEPDNITVNPADGSLYLMEDGDNEQFIVGVTSAGGLFKLVRNNINTSEFAGGCFSADGTKLFFNIQTPGITFMLYRTDGAPIVLS